jgi:fatty-acyl-CoA synthase
VATPTTQLDRTIVRQRVLEVLRELLAELGSTGALPMLRETSQLDADLGMGSLERVELLARIEAAFGVRLADRVVADANTPDDLADAILGAGELDTPDDSGTSAVRASVTANKLHRDAVAAGAYETQTLLELLRYRATHDAERTHLLITEDAEDGGEREVTLTFGELYAAGQRCAAELARQGVSAGARVALMLPSGRAFFAAYTGILLAGAVPVPIYPPFRADRIEEYAARQSAILNNAEVCLLLTFHRAEAVAKLLKPRVRSLTAVLDAEQLIANADKPAEVIPGALPLHLSGVRNRTSSDLALLQYTSGSTGDPKGVMLTHANLLANMRSIGEAMQLGPNDVGISWLPLYHDMGLIGAWLALLHFGTPLVVMSPLAFLTRPERWLQAFHKHRGTIAAAPNFAYELCVRKIADRDISGIDLSSWRIALNGAEPVNPETLQRFEKRFAPYGFRGRSMAPVYGLAEASLCVTFPPLERGPLVDRIERETFTTHGQAVPISADANAISFVSAGKVVNRMEVCIVDHTGQEVSDRTEGFLWFRGPSATSGFFRNPAATEKLLPQGSATRDGEYAWVNSGDRAYRAGDEIYITGRVKDIIIKGGRNLYPHEVEELAARVEGIRKGCIVAFGLKDEASGTERLLVVAEARERNGARRAAIVASITEQITKGLGLPPDRVELLPPGSIPKTSSGKLRREETKQLYLLGTLSKSRAPAWLQIARLGLASACSNFGNSIGHAARRTGQFAYGIYFVVVFSLWIVPSWFIVRFINDPRAAGRFTSSALKVLFAFTRHRVRVIGREFMDAPGAKIYAANHSSYFDVLPLILGLGVSYRFVSKIENRRIPFVGTFLKQMGHLTFDRANRDARLNQSKEIEDLLQRGESVFVFPEGTFLPEDGVRPFQLGAFKAAVATGAPVIPVSVAGARQILREGTWLPRPGNVTITLSPPLYPQSLNGHSVERNGANGEAGDWHQLIHLRDAARAAIASHSGEPLL